MNEKEGEKCPKCGKPVVIGWIGSAGAGLVTWIEGKKIGWGRAERLQSIWSGECLRAYRCKECGLLICYERGKQPDYEEVVGKTPESFLKKCVACGEMIPIASEYCPKCGTKQPGYEES